MNFTGFIRRIDSLGRIVIPKEIRNNLKLKSEDCLEISLENDRIVLTKKNLLKGCKDSLENVIDVLAKSFGTNIMLTDNDKILYCEGKLARGLLNKEISSDIYKLILSRKNIEKENMKFMGLNKISYVLCPIIVNGDIVGSVIIMRENPTLNTSDTFCAKLITELMIKNLEV